jgi:hypothetical protein
MKKILPLFVMVFTFSLAASAPEKFSVNDFEKHVGKKATLCDTVYSFKILSDTVTILNMGGKYPYQKFTIVVTGKEIVLNYDHIKGKHICATGDVSLYNNKPEVLIYHPDQIEFK